MLPDKYKIRIASHLSYQFAKVLNQGFQIVYKKQYFHF